MNRRTTGPKKPSLKKPNIGRFPNHSNHFFSQMGLKNSQLRGKKKKKKKKKSEIGTGPVHFFGNMSVGHWGPKKEKKTL